MKGKFGEKAMRLMWDLAFEVVPDRAEAAEAWQFREERTEDNEGLRSRVVRLDADTFSISMIACDEALGMWFAHVLTVDDCSSRTVYCEGTAEHDIQEAIRSAIKDVQWKARRRNEQRMMIDAARPYCAKKKAHHLDSELTQINPNFDGSWRVLRGPLERGSGMVVMHMTGGETTGPLWGMESALFNGPLYVKAGSFEDACEAFASGHGAPINRLI